MRVCYDGKCIELDTTDPVLFDETKKAFETAMKQSLYDRYKTPLATDTAKYHFELTTDNNTVFVRTQRSLTSLFSKPTIYKVKNDLTPEERQNIQKSQNSTQKYVNSPYEQRQTAQSSLPKDDYNMKLFYKNTHYIVIKEYAEKIFKNAFIDEMETFMNAKCPPNYTGKTVTVGKYKFTLTNKNGSLQFLTSYLDSALSTAPDRDSIDVIEIKQGGGMKYLPTTKTHTARDGTKRRVYSRGASQYVKRKDSKTGKFVYRKIKPVA